MAGSGKVGMGPVGTSVPKVDGAAKVTGAARYVDDLAVEGVLHGRTLRSSIPRGILRALRRDRNFDWTGITVVTADDIPGENTIAALERDQPALVPIGGQVRHVAEPLALVAAATATRAAAALAALHPEIDPLPAVHTIDDALAANAPLHGDDNIFRRYEIHKGDDVDQALASCDLVITGEYQTGAQEQMYLEPQGMLAWWDAAGTCRITGSLQCPYYVHGALTTLLGLPGDQVVITQAVTGGGFGGKEEYPSMLAAHAALLARAADAPVKMIYDRAEDIAATTKRHPSRVRHRLGLRNDGTIVACDVDVVLDAGAYITLSPVVLSRAVLHAVGPYRCEHVRVVGRAVATNTPPHGAFRGFGAPQTTFAYERQLDKAARALQLDPLALRRHNMLRLGDTTATGQLLEHSVGSAQVLTAVEPYLAQPVPVASRRGSIRGVVARGRGLAFYFHGAGFTGSGEQRLQGRATVATTSTGGFEIRSSSADIGQGSDTMFTIIAAEALGVSVDHVRMADTCTERVPDSGPTVASRTCMVVGKVVQRAATALRDQLTGYAAAHGLAADDLAAIAQAYHRAEETEAAQTCVYTPPPGIVWDDATYTGSAYPAYGWAACLVDLAVDLDTYEVAVERCVHAVDVGKAIHPIIVKGQIEGGTAQALGWALLENVVYDHGRVANASMSDCIIPTFSDLPELESILVEEPYPHGPHGAKGVGEIPMDGPAAAVANALHDALGVSVDQVPCLPEYLWEIAK